MDIFQPLINTVNDVLSKILFLDDTLNSTAMTAANVNILTQTSQNFP